MRFYFRKNTKTAAPTLSAPQQRKREKLIDIMRGFAVAVMIITHVIAITSSSNDSIIYHVGLFGGIFSFTAFLFLSGMAVFYSTFKNLSNTDHSASITSKGKKAGRVIKLLFAYYILATASIFVNTTLYSFPPSFSW